MGRARWFGGGAMLLLACMSVVAPPIMSRAEKEAPNPLACSACEIVVRLASSVVRQPSPKLQAREVTEERGGQRVSVPYPESQRFLHDVLGAACNSRKLLEYRVHQDWFGVSGYVHDPVPNYSEGGGGHPLQAQCRDLLSAHGSFFFAAFSARREGRVCGPEGLGLCEHLGGSQSAHLALAAREMARDPSLALRLAPLVLIALSIPFVLAPWLDPPPRIIEAAAAREAARASEAGDGGRPGGGGGEGGRTHPRGGGGERKGVSKGKKRRQ